MTTYKNYSRTTITGDLTSSSNSITVASGSIFPTSNFDVQIGSEFIHISSRSGTTLTVAVRGADGSTAAAHTSGDSIYYVANSDWVSRTLLTRNKSQDTSSGGGSSVGVGVYASRPAAGTAGDLYFSTDDNSTISVDNGTSWNAFGVSRKFKPMTIGDFTWVNQGSATATNYGSDVVMACPDVGTSPNLSLLVKSQPSTPYTITTFIVPRVLNKTYLSCGIAFRESSTGKLDAFHLYGTNPTVTFWTSPTVIGPDYVAPLGALGLAQGIWMRLTNDGIDRKAYFSLDGNEYQLIHSVAYNTDMTPNQVGFFVNAQNSLAPSMGVAMNILSYEES